MVKSKKSIFKKLIILATALLLVLVGISCKGKKPTEEGGVSLERPDDKVTVVGDPAGMMQPSDIAKYSNEMIHIRLVSDSSDGRVYRAPVISVFKGDKEGSGFIVLYERRYLSGAGDIGVDGNGQVDVVYMANGKGGNNMAITKDTLVGAQGKNPSAQGAPAHSRGVPVVFSKPTSKDIVIAAAAGGGFRGKKGNPSRIETIIGTAAQNGDTINFDTNGWQDINVEYLEITGTTGKATTNTNTGSKAIRMYVKEKLGWNTDEGNVMLYMRSGRGAISPDGKLYMLPISVTKGDGNGNGVSGGDAKGFVILYSTNQGTNWTLGDYASYNPDTYTLAKAMYIGNDGKYRVNTNPRSSDNSSRAIGIWEGDTNSAEKLTRTADSKILDSENANESTGYWGLKGTETTLVSTDTPVYFINNRVKRWYKEHWINAWLTISTLGDENAVKGLTSTKDMVLSRVAGMGSIAYLGDGTIVTVCEEAYAEGSKTHDQRFNIVQRRFTADYIKNAPQNRIREEEEFYNPEFTLDWGETPVK